MEEESKRSQEKLCRNGMENDMERGELGGNSRKKRRRQGSLNIFREKSTFSKLLIPGIGLFSFILIISCIALFGPSQLPNEIPLTRNTRKSEPTLLQIRQSETGMLARVINAIFLQNELSDPINAQNSPDSIISESLGLPQNLTFLSQLQPKKMEKAMGRIKEIRKNLQYTGQDLIKISEDLDKLNGWKMPILPPKIDSSGAFESLKSLKEGLNPEIFEDLDLSKIKNSIIDLRRTFEKDGLTVIEINDKMKEVEATFPQFPTEYINRIREYSVEKCGSVEESVTHLNSAFSGVNEYERVINQRIDQLTASTQLIPTKGQLMNQLKEYLSEIENRETMEILETLKSLMDHLENPFKGAPSSLYAYPRGTQHMKLVTSDLDTKWIKKALNNGSDVTNLRNSLKVVIQMYSNLDDVASGWTKSQKDGLKLQLLEDINLLKLVMEVQPGASQIVNYLEKIPKSVQALAGKIGQFKAQKGFPTDEELGSLVVAEQNFCEILNNLVLDHGPAIRKAGPGPDQWAMIIGQIEGMTNVTEIVEILKPGTNMTLGLISGLEALKSSGPESLKALDDGLGLIVSKKDASKTWTSENYESISPDFRRLDEDIQVVRRGLSPFSMERSKAQDPYPGLVKSFKTLVETKNLTSWVNRTYKTTGLQNMTWAGPMARELGFAFRAMTSFLYILDSKSIPEIQENGKKIEKVLARLKEDEKKEAGPWVTVTLVKALRDLKPEIEKFQTKLEVQKSRNSYLAPSLKDYSTVYKALDAVKLPKLDFSGLNKPLEYLWNRKGQRMVELKELMEWMNLLEGLHFASLRKKKNDKKMLEDSDRFFGKMFGLERDDDDDKETIIPFPPEIPLLIITCITLIHLILGPHYRRWEQYMFEYKATIPVMPLGPRLDPKMGDKPDEDPEDNSKNRLEASGDAVIKRGEVKIELKNDVDKIVDIPPKLSKKEKENMEKLMNMPAEEESNLLWVPFQDVEAPNMSYGSDDLRTIKTESLSTQSDGTNLMASTRSDFTIPNFSNSELSDPNDFRDHSVVPDEACHVDWNKFWENYSYPWAMKNRLTLQGYHDEEQLEHSLRKKYKKQEAEDEKAIKEHEKILKAIKKAEKEQEKAQKPKIVDLDEDAMVIWRRTINAEIGRIQAAKQEIEKEIENAQKLDPLSNVTKYVSDSYAAIPEEDLVFAQEIFKTIDHIDNFITSFHHDRWDHIYRCYSPRYTHDWCRVRMSKDDDEDCDFYDACYVYPLEFQKVEHLFKNQLICVASPMYPVTVGILWHWLYEHNVKFLAMVNQFVEKGLQTSEVWFPLSLGQSMRVRRNAHREYIIKCVEVKQKYKGNGIQRKFEITLVMNKQKVGLIKTIKVLHMIDWDQDGLPENWQHYVRICERINRESLQNPVAVMSKHGCGRAMTIILSLMAAIVARLDEGISFYGMVLGARKSKRQAITCSNQVLFFRYVHYELLFRWFKEIRIYRTQMQERFEVYQEACLAHKKDFLSLESRLWHAYYQYEMDRYKRMDFMVEYLRNAAEAKKYEMREMHLIQKVYDARTKSTANDERSPYYNGEPIRRKPLRDGDKKRDPKRAKREYVERTEFTKNEEMYASYGLDPLISGYKLNGCYNWVKPSEMKKKYEKGVPVPENYQFWLTKEQQKGMTGKRYF